MIIDTQIKWHQKPITIIILLWIFFPLGCYYMWKNEIWTYTTRLIITSILIIFNVLTVVNTINNFNSSSNEQQENTNSEIINVTGIYRFNCYDDGYLLGKGNAFIKVLYNDNTYIEIKAKFIEAESYIDEYGQKKETQKMCWIYDLSKGKKGAFKVYSSNSDVFVKFDDLQQYLVGSVKFSKSDNPFGLIGKTDAFESNRREFWEKQDFKYFNISSLPNKNSILTTY